MVAHIKVFRNLKQAIIYDFFREALMGKIHAAQDIPSHINQFDPILFADTATYESGYKYGTNAVWWGISKRLGTLVKEMTKATVIQSHFGHLNIYTTLKQNDGISKYEVKFVPNKESDGITINALTNICDIRFVITSENMRGGDLKIVLSSHN